MIKGQEKNVYEFVKGVIEEAKKRGYATLIFCEGYPMFYGTIEDIMLGHLKDSSSRLPPDIKQNPNIPYGAITFEAPETIDYQICTFYDFRKFLRDNLTHQKEIVFKEKSDRVWMFRMGDFCGSEVEMYYVPSEGNRFARRIGLFTFSDDTNGLECRIFPCTSDGELLNKEGNGVVVDGDTKINIEEDELLMTADNSWHNAFRNHQNGHNIRKAIWGLLSTNATNTFKI